MLDAGFRIAPSAASGFGRNGLDTHLGYNRIYVSLAGSESDSTWWERLKAGKAIVTNGPLLRPLINGELPGATLKSVDGAPIELQVDVSLTVRDPVEYLEVVFNSETLYRARLDEHAQRGGMIPPLKVARSGWVLVRVVTDHEPSYRFAMTAPYYVEIGGKTSHQERGRRLLPGLARRIDQEDRQIGGGRSGGLSTFHRKSPGILAIARPPRGIIVPLATVAYTKKSVSLYFLATELGLFFD
jgi:hypothetical protein